MKPRFLFYSHDGLGLGHTRRNLALAAAVTEAAPEASVLIATGSGEVDQLGVPANVDVLRLPGLRKLGNGEYGPRRLPLCARELGRLRAAALAAAVESFEPSVLIADKHPLGVHGELLPALEALHLQGGRAVLGMRDILDDPATVVGEWEDEDIPAQIERHYDRILVYGCEHVVDFVEEYGLPPELGERSRFCGYVVHPSADGEPGARPRPFLRRAGDRAHAVNGHGRRPFVLATAGSGEDGFAMLREFVLAAAGAPWDAMIVHGSRCSSPERAALERLAGEHRVATRTFVPHLSSWFPHADALVCMGGYNTLTEAVASGTAVVCVPRTHPRTEQLIRARAFEQRDLLRVLEPEALDPGLLRHEITAALAGPSRPVLAARARAVLDLEGARNAALELLELAAPLPLAAAA